MSSEWRLSTSLLGPQALEDEGIRKALDLLHRYHSRHERSYYRARKELAALQTAVSARFLLPKEVGDALPPLADPVTFTSAKRTADKAWPPEEIITITRVPPENKPDHDGGPAAPASPEANKGDNSAIIRTWASRVTHEVRSDGVVAVQPKAHALVI